MTNTYKISLIFILLQISLPFFYRIFFNCVFKFFVAGFRSVLQLYAGRLASYPKNIEEDSCFFYAYVDTISEYILREQEYLLTRQANLGWIQRVCGNNGVASHHIKRSPKLDFTIEIVIYDLMVVFDLRMFYWQILKESGNCLNNIFQIVFQQCSIPELFFCCTSHK